ncbi:MAG TPA: type VI secretion system lipoprotein TssJ [Acidobacteriota bacterium]|nr:type VI secretion system lipoprotein TssJ [Acidobacteriota bacterium]HNR39022.1 type VI secretion system lipoprotein TssJ [Acidobacteriota bacterium]HNT99362.1 type VI secretion system lipoprotein TssJ [Acidobacteriota bacterium]HPB29318.1 type VI secretion system lipoprotein TssJ [Acidobacteriota bacterium]HQO25612.1 type VI secretion system lipoprotein TssJ [Acidobacteriota bacterium]
MIARVVVHQRLVGLGLLLAVCVCACKKNAAPPPAPDWRFEPKAIQITYIADPMLNAYDGNAHATVLAIYQLTDINSFNNLAQSAEGLQKLLQAQPYDATVAAANRFFVQPGERNTLTLARAKSAQWVGVVAGYYQLTPGVVTRLLSIPVLIEHHGKIFKKTSARVDHLSVHLFLGPRAPQEIDPYDELE